MCPRKTLRSSVGLSDVHGKTYKVFSRALINRRARPYRFNLGLSLTDAQDLMFNLGLSLTDPIDLIGLIRGLSKIKSSPLYRRANRYGTK